MSNLGMYQEIVTAAAQMGGVEPLIRKIESGAVAKAAPGLLGKGAGIGALGTLAAGGIVFGVRWLWSTYQAREAAAVEAKEQLRAVVDEQEASDEANLSVDVDDHGTHGKHDECGHKNSISRDNMHESRQSGGTGPDSRSAPL